MQDDHGPHLRLKPEEAAFELVTIGDERFDTGGRRWFEFGKLDIDTVASEPSRLIDAGIDEQPVEPRVEAVRVPQRGQHAPGLDERVLDGVLGLIWITEDEPSGTIQAGDRGGCQLGEGVMIASPRSLHEVSLHVALGAGAAW
jgi:hypothetical protein